MLISTTTWDRAALRKLDLDLEKNDIANIGAKLLMLFFRKQIPNSFNLGLTCHERSEVSEIEDRALGWGNNIDNSWQARLLISYPALKFSLDSLTAFSKKQHLDEIEIEIVTQVRLSDFIAKYKSATSLLYKTTTSLALSVQAQALSFAENYICWKFFGKSTNVELQSRVLVATAELLDSDVVDLDNMIMR